MPVGGEFPAVAPVMIQVRRVTMQLSEYVGLLGETMAEHDPGVFATLMFPGHVMVGN